MPVKALPTSAMAGLRHRYREAARCGTRQSGISFRNAPGGHLRSVSSGSSEASCCSGSDSSRRRNYLPLGRIGATRTRSQTASSSSEYSFSPRSPNKGDGERKLRPAVTIRRRVHSPSRQSVPSRRSRHARSDNEPLSSYDFAISLSDVDDNLEADGVGDFSQLVGLAVRDANSSNRQQSTRRRSRRHDFLSPLPSHQMLSPLPSHQMLSPPSSPTADLHRRGRSAAQQHRDLDGAAHRWNENISNHSEIYCFRQQPQQRQRRAAGKQQLQQQQQKLHRMLQQQQPNKIYSGNHAESNLLLRRKLDSLRRLQLRRRSSCNLARSRCSDDDRWASFYDDDCESSENSEQEEPQLWAKDKRSRGGRAPETADWQVASAVPLNAPVPGQPWSDGARGCMRETRSHRETLFRCPYMALSLQTKIYECDKCAAKCFYNNANSSRRRIPKDSGSTESRSNSMNLVNYGRGDN